MSDLNQLIKAAKRGCSGESLAVLREKAKLLSEKYEIMNSEANYSICCVYQGELRGILNRLGEIIGANEYVEIDEFRNYSRSPEEIVIGCSRGCMPVKELSRRSYLEELCKECVEEARKFFNL